LESLNIYFLEKDLMLQVIFLLNLELNKMCVMILSENCCVLLHIYVRSPVI